MATIKFKLLQKTKKKLLLLFLRDPLPILWLPFWIYNTPTTFQVVIVRIFLDFIHDFVEVYMHDFTNYGD